MMLRTLTNSLIVSLLALLSFAVAGLPAAAAAGSTTAASQAPGNPLPTRFYYDFNTTLKPWQHGGYPGPVYEDNFNLEKGPLGHTFAAIARDTLGEGWMQTSFQTTGDSVQVAFQARDVYDCSGCMPVVYVGPKDPQLANDFYTLSEPLTQDWTKYDVVLPAGPGTVVVAIGYRTPPYMNPIEGQYTQAGFDNVYVNLLNSKQMGAGN